MKRVSILNPVEQRIYGLVHIAEGAARVIVGKYAPNWSYQYILRHAHRAAERRYNKP